MIKAMSDFKLPNVLIQVVEGRAYVFIYLNEVEKSETNEEENTRNYFEYDYNEFNENVKDLDVEEIQNNPEKYINFTPDERTTVQKVEDCETSISELEQCIMDMSEIVYN